MYAFMIIKKTIKKKKVNKRKSKHINTKLLKTCRTTFMLANLK